MKYKIKRKRDGRDPVAYIDHDGDLVIQSCEEGAGALDLRNDGFVYRDLPWEPDAQDPDNLIYPGDSITLTF